VAVENRPSHVLTEAIERSGHLPSLRPNGFVIGEVDPDPSTRMAVTQALATQDEFEYFVEIPAQ
jgi:hypothetical protein